MSTVHVAFTDEPFAIRDIQFNNPQIGVACPAPIQIFGKLVLFFSYLLANNGPLTAPIELGHALQRARISAAFRKNEKDGAGLTISLAKHGTKASGRLGSANQPRHFEVSRDEHGRCDQTGGRKARA